MRLSPGFRQFNVEVGDLRIRGVESAWIDAPAHPVPQCRVIRV